MNSNKNKVNKNPQFTKVQITQNNPLEFDMSHDNISKALRDLKSLQYYIMGDEIGGKDGTYHLARFFVTTYYMFRFLEKEENTEVCF